MEDPIVEISDGKLRGTILKNFDDENTYAFLGIPYAKPPVGELRFKAPEPIGRWEGVKDATKYAEKPLHLEPLVTSEIQGSEDCLYLNVHMKNLPDENSPLKPVLLYIFGGKFRQGSNHPDLFGTDFLLMEDFVFVFPNYRLGLLGFLSLQDPALDVPGNAGMKDQVLALQWVQKNIRGFGGDPDNVTIAGHSSGGSAVHYHLFSPSSRGLFHKAIAMSGTVFWKWTEKDEFSLDLLLEVLNIKTKSEREILEHLRNLPAKAIMEAQNQYFDMHDGTGLVIGPVIENPNRTAFLTEDPTNLLLNGEFAEVPILFSYTSHEALMFDIIDHMLGTTTKFSIEPEDFIPKAIKSKMNSTTLKNIFSEIERVYASEDLSWRRCMILSDRYFIAPQIAAAKTQAALTDKPVYLMRWSIDDDLNVMKKTGGMDCPGTSHVDEMGYIFRTQTIPKPVKGTTADKAIRKILHIWKNFCEYGNPSLCQSDIGSEWKPLQCEKRKVLDFGSEIKFIDIPEWDRMELWQKILDNDERNKKLTCLKVL